MEDARDISNSIRVPEYSDITYQPGLVSFAARCNYQHVVIPEYSINHYILSQQQKTTENNIIATHNPLRGTGVPVCCLH